MSSSNEVILALIPGVSDQERLMVVHRHAADASRVELRRQTWGEGIGWFTQNSLPLHPGQLAQLRGALGGPVAEFPPATIGMNVDPQRPKLKIFAESA